jgi:hypothetical protein
MPRQLAKTHVKTVKLVQIQENRKYLIFFVNLFVKIEKYIFILLKNLTFYFNFLVIF